MAGNYTATLTVTDGQGRSSADSDTVTVFALPSASAGPKENGTAGEAINFAGSASGGMGSLTYSWAFGDGTTATGSLTPSHTYTAAAAYGPP